jgi:hypothetical protein
MVYKHTVYSITYGMSMGLVVLSRDQLANCIYNQMLAVLLGIVE